MSFNFPNNICLKLTDKNIEIFIIVDKRLYIPNDRIEWLAYAKVMFKKDDYCYNRKDFNLSDKD